MGNIPMPCSDKEESQQATNEEIRKLLVVRKTPLFAGSYVDETLIEQGGFIPGAHVYDTDSPDLLTMTPKAPLALEDFYVTSYIKTDTSDYLNNFDNESFKSS
jgi:hypothetical protein